MLIWSDNVNEWVTSTESKKLLHKKNLLNFILMDTFCLFSYPDEEKNCGVTQMNLEQLISWSFPIKYLQVIPGLEVTGMLWCFKKIWYVYNYIWCKNIKQNMSEYKLYSFILGFLACEWWGGVSPLLWWLITFPTWHFSLLDISHHSHQWWLSPAPRHLLCLLEIWSHLFREKKSQVFFFSTVLIFSPT